MVRQAYSPNHASPCRGATRTATSITSPDETSAGASIATREPTQITNYYSPRHILFDCFLLTGRDRPDPAQPQPDGVVTQKYPLPFGSRSSTPICDLAKFDSANSGVTMSESPGVPSVVPSDVLPVMARFMPLNPPGSQASHLSSEQLSPNRVRSDFDVETVNLFPRNDAETPASDHTGTGTATSLCTHGPRNDAETSASGRTDTGRDIAASLCTHGDRSHVEIPASRNTDTGVTTLSGDSPHGLGCGIVLLL